MIESSRMGKVDRHWLRCGRQANHEIQYVVFFCKPDLEILP